MFRSKTLKTIALISVVTMFLGSVLSTWPIQQSSAAYVIGNSGVLPSGGVSGPGGYCEATIYRVGVTTEEYSTENQILPTDSESEILSKIEKHYSNHFPNIKNAIMFAPSSCYSQKAYIGEWNPSSGGLQMVHRNANPTSHDARLRKLIPDNREPSNLYYDKLLQRAGTRAEISKLQRGGWKNVINSVGSNGAEEVWFRILSNHFDIKRKIENYTDEINATNLDIETQYKAILKYVDLLMTLYAISPSGEQRGYYEKVIDTFLEGKDLGKKPVTIAIDTAVRFSASSVIGDNYLFVPSIDYVQWMHGGTANSNLLETDFPAPAAARLDSKKLIQAAANMAMAEMPNRERKTDKPSSTDGFTWGYGGVVGEILRTDSTAKTSRWLSSSVTSPIMESLVFRGNMYGFMITGNGFNKPVPECNCQQSVSVPNKSDIEGKLKEKSVGKKLTLAINLSPKDKGQQALQDWKDQLASIQSNSLKIKVRLWRTGGTGTPNWSKVVGPLPATNAEPEKYVGLAERIKSPIITRV